MLTVGARPKPEKAAKTRIFVEQDGLRPPLIYNMLHALAGSPDPIQG
jgi:hypothetical protein